MRRAPFTSPLVASLLFATASLAACGGGVAQPEAPAAPTTAGETAPAEPSPSRNVARDDTKPGEATDDTAPAPGDDKAGAESVPAHTPLGGTLSRDEIKAIVEQHGAHFNDCYTIGAGKSQQFVANITLKVTLGPSGSVSDVKVTKSTAKNPKVDQCVIDGFKKMKFPAPKSGATSVFTFPMEFKGAVEVR